MSSIVDLIIRQEKQLYMRKEPVSVLSEFIDNEFIEIGSSAKIHDKKEVIRWLESKDPSTIHGTNFKATFLSDTILLLTYTSTISSPQLDTPKHALRSSIWRLSTNKWQMVFHQGTPIITR